MSKRSFALAVLVLAMLATFAAPSAADSPACSGAVTVTDVDLLGVNVLPDGTYFEGTLVGGLSGMTYDPIKDVYYVISDDKSEFAPARYYTVSVDPDTQNVTFEDVTFLRYRGHTYAEGSIDLEGIEWFSKNKLFVSNERDESNVPSVLRLNRHARVNRSLKLPPYYLPAYNQGDQVSGVYTNLAFESLTLTPDHRTLVTATEASLVQDGLPATHDEGSNARVLEFSARGFRPAGEYVYPVGPIPKGEEADDGDNGLSELVALDNAGTFLAMERSYVGGFGNTIRLYETSTTGATDVAGWFTLEGKTYTPMSKDLVVDLEDDLGLEPGVTLDNMEGMAFGPTLPDGRRILVLVSDDNFNPTYQNTVFIVLAVTLDS